MSTQELKWELTGRRRGYERAAVTDYVGRREVPKIIVCQVEEKAYAVYAGVGGYETRWRNAKAEDLPNETIVRF